MPSAGGHEGISGGRAVEQESHVTNTGWSIFENEKDIKDAIRCSQTWPLWRGPLEYVDLVPQSQDLCLESDARSKADEEG